MVNAMQSLLQQYKDQLPQDLQSDETLGRFLFDSAESNEEIVDLLIELGLLYEVAPTSEAGCSESENSLSKTYHLALPAALTADAPEALYLVLNPVNAANKRKTLSIISRKKHVKNSLVKL
jgi:hypothetical protein